MSEPTSPRPGVARTLLSSVYFWLLVGCLITLLAMWVYPFLPQKKLDLTDSQLDVYIYADDRNGVEWIATDERHWQCLVQSWHSSAFCGFNMALAEGGGRGVDLSQYKTIELDLEYTGPSKALRYYFRNSEPGFSEPGNPERDKFIQSQISVNFLDGGLKIGLDEFYVAEWWLTEYEVPRALSGPKFDSVTSFGIDLSYPAPQGKHSMHLRGIELVGVWVSREQWYAGVLGAWVLLLAGTGLVRLYRLRNRLLLERERREKTVQRNRELREQSEQFKAQSRTDQLTGLLNRHGLIDEIAQQFADPEMPLTLMVLDIDHFKPINDQYGHDVGDQVLAQLGTLLSGHTRETDVVARWGGEEFVLLLPGTTEEAAERIAEKIRARIAETEFTALPGEYLTVSVGYGVRQRGEDYHALFRRVDLALYRAKDQGRNRTCFAPVSP